MIRSDDIQLKRYKGIGIYVKGNHILSNAHTAISGITTQQGGSRQLCKFTTSTGVTCILR